MEKIIANAKFEAQRLSEGKKISATNLRRSLLEVQKLCGESRKAVLASGRAIPVKKRTKKEVPEMKAPADGGVGPKVILPPEMKAKILTQAEAPKATAEAPKAVAEPLQPPALVRQDAVEVPKKAMRKPKPLDVAK